MPGTDDVERAVDIVNAQAAALAVEPLLHPLHQAALADRSALMGAIIAPGVERAIDVEDPDLHAVNLDHLALAVRDIGLACHEDFSAGLHLQLVGHCCPLSARCVALERRFIQCFAAEKQAASARPCPALAMLPFGAPRS